MLIIISGIELFNKYINVLAFNNRKIIYIYSWLCSYFLLEESKNSASIQWWQEIHYLFSWEKFYSNHERALDIIIVFVKKMLQTKDYIK